MVCLKNSKRRRPVCGLLVLWLSVLIQQLVSQSDTAVSASLGSPFFLYTVSQVLTKRNQKIITQVRKSGVLSPSEQMKHTEVCSTWGLLHLATEITGSDWGCALVQQAHRAADPASVEFPGSFSIIPPCWLLRRTTKPIFRGNFLELNKLLPDLSLVSFKMCFQRKQLWKWNFKHVAIVTCLC